MNTATAVIVGSLAGAAYFVEGERGIPRESNCSYMSPASTDVLAWLGGAYLIHAGHQHDAPGVAMVGAAIASLHTAQWATHKASTRPSSQLYLENW